MGTVVVVGSLNVDLVVGLDRMPNPGETVMGRTLDQHPGGKGLNQAVAAARLGARVEMIGAVGNDDSGAWLRGIVTSEGIGDSRVRTVDGPSGTALIEVDRSGMNRIVVVPGANGKVSPDDVAAALSDIDDLAIVLTQGEVPLASIEAAMVVGKAKGARTILNPAPVLDYPLDLLRAVDIVLPNEHEAAQLTGLDTSTLEGAQAAASHLVSLGVACAIITRGGDGAIWATGESSGSIPVFPVTPVDTVAAGDAFCGGLVAALAEGHELTEAFRWAAAAGGLATTKAGAVPSLPTRSELETLIKR
jgi:ribokinase